ncbi:hypothetical protein Nmel_018520 [Mimus melanotis]
MQDRGAVIPIRVHTIVISVQHDEDVCLDEMRDALKEKVIKAVVPPKYLDDDTIYHLQPSGRFVIGGPQGDAGLTGRKIIVDTYGGWGAHGGGAFSGKDYTKVDRSAAYAARWVAKSLVKAGLCRRVLVQVSYAIGVSHPLSISIFHYGTSQKSERELLEIVKKNFDLRPGVIVSCASSSCSCWRHGERSTSSGSSHGVGVHGDHGARTRSTRGSTSLRRQGVKTLQRAQILYMPPDHCWK